MIVILSYLVVPIFFLTFDDSILTLCSSNITFDNIFVTFGINLIFSHIWRFHPHNIQFQYYIWQYFLSHLVVPFFFFLIFDGSILILCSKNITCDYTFVTFNSSIFTSSSTNITSNSTFIIFGGYLYFLPTFDSSILISCNTNIISDCIVITFDDNLIFLLTFKGSIVTLRSIN